MQSHPEPQSFPNELPPQQQRRSRMIIMQEHPEPPLPKLNSPFLPHCVADKSLIYTSLHFFFMVYAMPHEKKCYRFLETLIFFAGPTGHLLDHGVKNI